MTTNTQAYLQEVKELAEKAHQEIGGLASGKRRWEMRIPVQKIDSDIVLQAPLDAIAKLVEAVELADEMIWVVKNNPGWNQEHRDYAIQCEQKLGRIFSK